MIGSARRTAGRPQQRSHEIMRYPAPVGGVDTRIALGSNDLNHCIYTYNLMPQELGMTVRQGYREWALDVENSVESGLGVHTLIPFEAIAAGSAGNKLFAVTNEGIWDVTAYDTAPVKVAIFSVTSADAGYGTYTHYVNQAERDVLFYADNLNGLWEYDAVTELWSVPLGVTGITLSEVNFVVNHKNNVWFGLRDSTVGYYLPILASSGAVTPQYFGDKFKHGGALRGLFSWTVDGGNGVDDIFVAVSAAGDVIMYVGAGPDASDWGMKGVYYIGPVPNTPRFGSEQGGELYLLSAYGLVSMNELLQGVDTSTLLADAVGHNNITVKIASLIRAKMKDYINDSGWDVSLIPSEGGMLITTPFNGTNHIQYYFNLATKGWGIWRGVPMTCFTDFDNAVFFGTAGSDIYKMDVAVDNAVINPPNPAFNGEDIQFSILTAFSNMGIDGVYKRTHLIRPDFVSTQEPSHTSLMRYDFNTEEGVEDPTRQVVTSPVGIWDLDDWDAAVWGSTDGVTFPSMAGAWGYGRYGAIATRGSSRTNTNLVGWDVIYTSGGPMY